MINLDGFFEFWLKLVGIILICVFVADYLIDVKETNRTKTSVVIIDGKTYEIKQVEK
jgi:hypothetical protein